MTDTLITDIEQAWEDRETITPQSKVRGAVEKALGMTFPLSDRVNSSTHSHYSNYYSKQDQLKVSKVLHKDIAYFGYEFEDLR